MHSSLAAAVPIALAILYVAALKLGKPKSYDVDFFRSLGMRLVRLLHRTGVLRSTLDLYADSGRRSVHPYHKG